MTKIQNKWIFFNDQASLAKLNRLLSIHENLMPHQLAAATGCNLDEAMQVLMYLFYLRLARLYLLVYHISHSEPVLKRSIFDGFPELPIICPSCELEIIKEDELEYDFLFSLLDKIEFI